MRRITLPILIARLFTLLLLRLISVSVFSHPAHAYPAVSAQGYAWIDQNCDGMRQDTEPSAALVNLEVNLYSFGVDGQPFTSDDRQLDYSGVFHTPGVYQFTAGPGSPYLMRVSIIQGARPAGYMPTKFHQGTDSTTWSDLQGNWTTPGFMMNPDAMVNGGNLGIAPISACVATFTNKVYAPLLLR